MHGSIINKNEFILNAKETNRYATIDLIPANRCLSLADSTPKTFAPIYVGIGLTLYAPAIKY
jgi:hypothetical protein